MSRLAKACTPLLLLGCVHSLDVGTFGTFRYIGTVQGAPPLNLLPPISDRNADLFTLNGALNLPKTIAFVSRADGGSLAACNLTKGDAFGAHGWVGFGQDRAWYWSGDALVVVPSSASCQPLLDKDPSTGIDLFFRAIIPWVQVSPSRSTLVALIQAQTDPAPYSALIDLGSGTLIEGVATNLAAFAPSTATNVNVIGVGADPDNGVGFVLLSYTSAGATKMEGRFYDQGANLIASAPIMGAPPPAYGVVGYLQPSSSGQAIGLTSSGSLVTFNHTGGQIVPIDHSITPAGVHRWTDQLWLVGTSQGKPMIAPIADTGQIGGLVEWTASERALASIKGTVTVSDDRSFPARLTTWSKVVTGIGAFPFLSPFALWPHATGATLWAIAGPEFTNDAMPETAVAIAPVGVSYP